MIKIVIAENERAELDSIKSYLATQRDVQVVGEARDGKECQDMVTRLRPDIALLRIDLPVINGLDVAEHITTKLPDVGVILILTGNEGQDAWRKMLQAGIKDFVTRPLNAERVIEEVRKISEQQAKRRENPAGGGQAATIPSGPTRQVITVTGPRGGCGKTIIATNLAVGLAKSSEKVALVDLNLWGGDVAMMLDMAPKRTLGDLLPGFGGIDYDVIEAMMVKHASGVSVLAAPLTGTFDGATLSRYMVQSILEPLREHYDLTIVDTGFANLESTLAAMEFSDVILVVVGMDLPRLRDCKHYLKNLLAANYAKEKIRVLVNRSTGSREISTDEVETILEFPVTTQLATDDALVNSSVNLGQPFVLASPNKVLSKSIITLADQLQPGAASAIKKRTGSKWFSLMQ